MLSTLLLALLGGSQAVAALLIMPIALLLSAAFYTSLYFTFADCFEMPSTPPADEKEPAP